ncbi:hypothetical protein EG68_06435 [Paragonimus skrjabini miyazakii]|uniref:RabBD domain-containing protein n=1 Tax=Paragonimus skrjabini miyazakii TaxID=59628 RepID=A0A8S9Z2S5_9TREM|nr:hypothetical protein EG68_06435 [Paragonimus skrjabini miyazakii]
MANQPRTRGYSTSEMNPRQPGQSGSKPGSVTPDAPDLSHLTPEERRIIESVMNRQKEEEKKDAEVIKQYTEDALDRDYQEGSESGCYQYDISSNKTLQRGGRIRGQYSRPIDSSQSQGFSRQDLHHCYYTDSLTSEQSDSPARAHSMAGWPTAYQPSLMTGRYSTGGTGRSDSEYSPEPRTYGGNRPYGHSSWAKPRATELSPAFQDRGRFRKSMC